MLVGRSAETAAIGRVLEEARAGRGGALVIRGEAGVGKSALLDEAAGDARGFTILRGYGVDVESELAYAALHQILRPAFGRIERLPEVQAAALRSAFALSTETVDERFRVSLGVLGLLSEQAGDGPLLCLVDDAQWLDQASADALLFVARRLEGEAIALVFTARDDDRPFVARGIPELRLGALGPADARRLVSERLGANVPPSVVEWLVENANGNPRQPHPRGVRQDRRRPRLGPHGRRRDRQVIVAAGIMMGVVFWAFVLGDDRTIKAFGVGLGVAILADALIVRMTLVPAIMHLLGDRAWYMPRWLGRLLPHITIEPSEEPEEAPEAPRGALPQTA